MIVIVGIMAIIVGLIGYSLIPEKKLNEEKYLSSIVNFYMIVCFTLFFHMYTNFYQMNHLFVELFFGFSMTVAAFYLLWSVVFDGRLKIRFERHIDGHIDPQRLKNGILYASIAWLMGKELAFLKLQPFMIPGLILLPVFFVLLYPLLVMKELRLFFFYENFSSVFSNSFLTVLFSGVAIISMALTTKAYIPIESLAAITALYVILRMSKAAEPFME
jgi:hypothetical protein